MDATVCIADVAAALAPEETLPALRRRQREVQDELRAVELLLRGLDAQADALVAEYKAAGLEVPASLLAWHRYVPAKLDDCGERQVGYGSSMFRKRGLSGSKSGRPAAADDDTTTTRPPQWRMADCEPEPQAGFALLRQADKSFVDACKAEADEVERLTRDATIILNRLAKSNLGRSIEGLLDLNVGTLAALVSVRGV
jgi:hypothetical protein